MTNLPLNSYVELMPGFEEVYDDAPSLARGYVREAAEDEFGYDKVFVEWDRTIGGMRGKRTDGPMPPTSV
jgi:hypothetical protein